MSYKTICMETDDRGVARLTLNVPDRHNALSGMMITELTKAAEQLGSDDVVRVVVLTGEGKSFCAGGDLGWMKRQRNQTREERMEGTLELARMLRAMNELPKPVIGRIQGQAFGGGIGMMSICDVAIGVDTAKFGLTETRLGLIPATIGPYVVARMGEGNARRVFMSGRRFDAHEAEKLGLLAKVVSKDELDSAVEAEVEPYLSTAPGAVAASKALVRSLGPRIDDAVMKDTASRLADTLEGKEAAEGISAFLEKRKPLWIVSD